MQRGNQISRIQLFTRQLIQKFATHMNIYNYQMNFVNFSYKTYTQNKYKYQPIAWPPDIDLAEFHSRSTRPGDPLLSKIICPCCNNFIKQKYTPWVFKDVFNDFMRQSSGICGYFILLRSFFVLAFWMVLVGSIYQLILINKYCSLPEDIQQCYNIGVLHFVDFLSISKSYPQEKNILGILAIVIQYLTLITNIIALHNLISVKKDSQWMFTHNTVLISGANGSDLQKFMRQNNFQNFYVFPLLSIYKQYQLRKQAILLFFTIQSNNALEYHLKDQQKLIYRLTQKLYQINEQNSNRVFYIPQNFLITFKYDYQAKKFNKKAKITNFNCQYLKYPDDIRWKTSGQPISKFKFIITISNLIFMIVVMSVLLIIPLKKDYQLNQKSLKQLTLTQLVQCYALSVLFSVSCYLFDYIVKRQSKHIVTYTSRSQRIILFNIIYAVIFYIYIPLIFTLILDTRNQGVMVYVIVQQAAVVMVIQVIVSIFDPDYYFWNTQKSLLLGDIYTSTKYNQQQLNKKVTCIKYPILNKLMTFFRIYAFSFAFSIISPYIPILLLVSSILLYAFEKRNIYNHYRASQLNIAVIIYAFMYFSILCDLIFAGYLSSFIVLKFQLPSFYMIPVIGGFAVAQIYKIWVYRNRYSVDNQQAEINMDLNQQLQQDITIQLSQKGAEQYRKSNLACLQEIENYDITYKKFISKMRNEWLFSQIDLYFNMQNMMMGNNYKSF